MQSPVHYSMMNYINSILATLIKDSETICIAVLLVIVGIYALKLLRESL